VTRLGGYVFTVRRSGEKHLRAQADRRIEPRTPPPNHEKNRFFEARFSGDCLDRYAEEDAVQREAFARLFRDERAWSRTRRLSRPVLARLDTRSSNGRTLVEIDLVGRPACGAAGCGCPRARANSFIRSTWCTQKNAMKRRSLRYWMPCARKAPKSGAWRTPDLLDRPTREAGHRCQTMPRSSVSERAAVLACVRASDQRTLGLIDQDDLSAAPRYDPLRDVVPFGGKAATQFG